MGNILLINRLEGMYGTVYTDGDFVFLGGLR